jgi:uncharacterized protein (DUF1697 family)
MTAYISLLRGINLGAHKQIKMPALKALYETLGLTKVQTYIQSGNVVFESDESAETLAPKIQAAVEKEYGFLAETIVISRKELKAIIEANPFSDREAQFVHYTVLEAAPKPEVLEKLGEVQAENDEYRIIGRTIYLYCPNGYGRTKLNNNFWERKLKLVATTRNSKSMMKLLELSGE